MSLKIEKLEVSHFQQNCRIVWDSDTHGAAIIDPGGDVEKIFQRIDKLGLIPESVVLTHSHIDHCGGVADVIARYAIPLYAHQSESFFRANIENTAAMYGLAGSFYKNCPEPDNYLKEGERLVLLGREISVFETPGHSPGSVSLYFPELNCVISGDVLFSGSIGRTDLPGGDYAQLISSINRLLRELPAETQVLSGHGPDTTLGIEKESNPFLNS